MKVIRGFFPAIAVLTLFWVAYTPEVGHAEKPVTVLVPFPAGGSTDLLTRALVLGAKPYFPNPFLVINRPGGAGTIGAVELFNAKPDGYTIANFSNTIMTLQPHRRSDLPYKGPDDFGSVLKVAYQPFVFCVRADAPWRAMQQAIDYARANPGKIRVGTSGEGSTQHIDLILLMEKAGVNFTHVPFSGDADFMAAVLGGHIEAALGSPASVAPQLQAGKIRVLATFGDKRHILFPETPTCLELGYEVTVTASHYMMVPKRTPDPMVRTLRDTFKKAMEEKSFKEFIRQSGWVSDYKDPAEMKKELDEYYTIFGKTVEKLKLK